VNCTSYCVTSLDELKDEFLNCAFILYALTHHSATCHRKIPSEANLSYLHILLMLIYYNTPNNLLLEQINPEVKLGNLRLDFSSSRQ
jgi:hypothetical protein